MTQPRTAAGTAIGGTLVDTTSFATAVATAAAAPITGAAIILARRRTLTGTDTPLPPTR